ncbi:hypothetical protein CJ483_01415 [Bacillus sp. PK3_68]|nr:hypothetical protein CJ483_01415 [Bacillus sp. PK3_68]
MTLLSCFNDNLETSKDIGGTKMEIKYELTKDDYLAFNLHYVKHSKTIKQSLFRQQFFVPIIFLILPFIFPLVAGEFSVGFSIVFMLVSVVWMIFYPKYFYWHVMSHINKSFNEGNNENLLGEHTFTFNDEGFIETNRAGESQVSWSSIEKVEENDQYFFLFFSTMSAYILPKRSFLNETDQKNFQRRMDQRISSAASK